MNGEIANGEKADDVGDGVDATDTGEDTVVMAEDTIVISEDLTDIDSVGDISAEINVEELVAKLEATDDDNLDRKREIRKRLERLRDQQDAELDSTYNFNLDEDL